MQRIPRDIEANITFLRTEDGGRSLPLPHGVSYRPQFHYSAEDWDCVVEATQQIVVNPGESFVAFVSFLSPDKHYGRLQVGSAFLLREGQNIVGYGSVSALLELRDSAECRTSANSGLLKG